MYSIRGAKAAGIFYNADRASLLSDIESFYASKDGPGEPESEDAPVFITPHDRYGLCGKVCAWAFSKIPSSNYVIIGPNHMENGAGFSVMREGLWKTPLGDVATSSRLAESIMGRCSTLEYDVNSHENEHSVEVQIPLLQHRFGSDFKIVPISVRNRFEDEDFVKECESLGRAVAGSIMSQEDKWTIIATTDFSSGKRADVERVDKSIIDSIKNLSAKKFVESVDKNGSHICGYGAVLVALAAAKEMKAKKSKLLKYAAVADTTKPKRVSVGYASMVLK